MVCRGVLDSFFYSSGFHSNIGGVFFGAGSDGLFSFGIDHRPATGAGIGTSTTISPKNFHFLPHDGKFVFAFFDDGDLVDINFCGDFGAVNRDGISRDKFAGFFLGIGEFGIH